jgi:restriction endonuclease Mrr
LKSIGSTPDPGGEAQLDVNKAIERHNRSVHQQLKAAIEALSPKGFELLVVKVLTALGYDVEHTGQTNDGGVDANAVLSLGGLTSVMTRVQAKRWGHSVPGRVVRELRGALKVDERGLIVTTA